MEILATAPAARLRNRSWFRPALSRAVLPFLAGALMLGCGGSHGVPNVIVTNVAPTQGLEGTQVTLLGSGMHSTTAIAFGNGVAAEWSIVSDTQLIATVPASATTGLVTVTSSVNVFPAGTFTVLPQIVGLVPASGPLGTEVKLTGSGFQGTTQVLFAGEPASGAGSPFTVEGPNQINVVLASDATTGPVQITVAGTQVTGPTFTVTN